MTELVRSYDIDKLMTDYPTTHIEHRCKEKVPIWHLIVRKYISIYIINHDEHGTCICSYQLMSQNPGRRLSSCTLRRKWNNSDAMNI